MLLYSWDFPGKNTGVGCHFLLQGIFPTQGLNPVSAWQADLHHWAWEALTLEGMCLMQHYGGREKTWGSTQFQAGLWKLHLAGFYTSQQRNKTDKTSVPKIISFWNLALLGETDRQTECCTGRYFSKSTWGEEKEQPEQVCVKSMCDSSISSGMKCWFDTRNAFDILSWPQNNFMRPGVSEIQDDLKVAYQL